MTLNQRWFTDTRLTEGVTTGANGHMETLQCLLNFSDSKAALKFKFTSKRCMTF